MSLCLTIFVVLQSTDSNSSLLQVSLTFFKFAKKARSRQKNVCLKYCKKQFFMQFWQFWVQGWNNGCRTEGLGCGQYNLYCTKKIQNIYVFCLMACIVLHFGCSTFDKMFDFLKKTFIGNGTSFIWITFCKVFLEFLVIINLFCCKKFSRLIQTVALIKIVCMLILCRYLLKKSV